MALNDRYNAMLEKCTSSLDTWKKTINRLEDADKIDERRKLEELAKEYCVIDNNHKKTEKVLREIEESMNDPNRDYDIDAMIETRLAELSDDDITDNEIWGQIFQNKPSVFEVVPKTKVDKSHYEQVHDDSLLCSDAFTAPIDPISKIVIRKPVKNKICKHVYDRNTIYDYIRQSKNKAKCPYIGCNNNRLKTSDLIEDSELEQVIAKFLETQRDDESDDSD